jgi:serine/threonine-protein kinase HipA
LTAARTAVSRFEDVTAVVVTRSDRVERDGSIVRVHQEDLCQALSVPPDRKYENESGPGVERIAALLRDVMSASESEGAVRRFADALIWNSLIAGTDAHAKNYSLLLACRELLGVESQLARRDGRRRASWQNGAGARADDLAQRAPDAVADAARDPHVTALARPLGATLANRVADRAGRCRELLTGNASS